MGNRLDLVGKTFGRLEVIEFAGMTPNHKSMWKCKCSCGNEVIVRGSHLTNGLTVSCGCYSAENTSNLFSKSNKVEEITPNILKIYCNKDKFFICDKDTWEKFSCEKICWRITSTKTNKGKYERLSVIGNLKKQNSDTPKTISFCHYIHPENKVTDHSNGNTLDNRECNLRSCTTAENNMNSKPPSNNTSGYKGVSFSKRDNKWRARIVYEGHEKSLGLYDNKEDAIKARQKAEKELFGEYSFYSEENRNGRTPTIDEIIEEIIADECKNH